MYLLLLFWCLWFLIELYDGGLFSSVTLFGENIILLILDLSLFVLIGSIIILLNRLF